MGVETFTIMTDKRKFALTNYIEVIDDINQYIEKDNHIRFNSEEGIITMRFDRIYFESLLKFVEIDFKKEKV